MEFLGIKYVRANNDYYGNPRYIVHYSAFLSDDERETIRLEVVLESEERQRFVSVSGKYYDLASQKSRAIGGKKYRGKDFGGGIVFQSYNVQDDIRKISEMSK